MPSAAFTFSGASGSLAALSTTAGATVTATLDDLSGVRQVQWSVLATDDSTTAGAYTLATSGSFGSTVTFTAGAEGTTGILQVRINGGINAQTEATDATLTKVAQWYVPLSNGYAVGAVGEEFTYDSTFGWTKKVNDGLRHGAALSLDAKRSVRVATATTLPANTRSGNVLTANANASINGTGIDGKTDLALNQRVLVKDEATGANNGIYYLTQVGSASLPWKLTRATDADTSAELSTGALVYVEEGTVNGASQWLLTTLSVTLNTTAQVWKEDCSTDDKSDLDAATSAATANKLVRRGASAEASFAALTGTTVTASTKVVATTVDTGAATDLTVQRNSTSILAVNSTGVRFDSAISPMVDVGTAATASPLKIRAGTSSAGNANGGAVRVSGGTPNGTGLKGGVEAWLGTETDLMIEATEVATGRRVVVLGRGSAVTTTQLPSNSGDRVVYVADAATAPTAAAVSGATLYSEGARLKTYGPTGAAVIGVIESGCDGNDGDVTLGAGTTTLTRDMQYRTLVVPSGATLEVAGYKVMAQLSITVQSGGVVQNNGSNGAAGGTAGAGATSGAYAGGSNGGAGGTGAGSAGSNHTTCIGGAGGAGGSGSGGAGGAAGTVTAPTAAQGSVRTREAALFGSTLSAGAAPASIRPGTGGGGGGGDGTAGGGGGGGGGLVVLVAPIVTIAGTVRANGGNGGTPAAGDRGGGGAGGGGIVYIVANHQYTATGTVEAAAGTPGSGAGTGTAGSAGSSGSVIRVVPAT